MKAIFFPMGIEHTKTGNTLYVGAAGPEAERASQALNQHLKELGVNSSVATLAEASRAFIGFGDGHWVKGEGRTRFLHPPRQGREILN